MKTIVEYLVNNHVNKGYILVTDVTNIREGVYIKTSNNSRELILVKVKNYHIGKSLETEYTINMVHNDDEQFSVYIHDKWHRDPFEPNGLKLYKFDNDDMQKIDLVEKLIQEGKIKVPNNNNILSYTVSLNGTVKIE